MTTAQAPISLYGFLRPRPERADEVRQFLASLVEPTRREEGNLEYHLHAQDDGRLFLYEVWRSQEDLDRHNATPALRHFLDHLLDFLEEAPDGYFDTMISPYPRESGESGDSGEPFVGSKKTSGSAPLNATNVLPDRVA
ncbi:putative quinol monooxygenase [Streptomyces sp. 135]|uniref:putative quinol monooxygenase n=1 Tax=Streptomyces sp. 135 TaxID=2838850 RepID=UPI001CBBCF6B|nr:putative quinol monooxygenase [Streptomyces sp. 135]